MKKLCVTAGSFRFEGKFESAAAPKTCEIFRRLLPYENKIIHVRWSGEAVWVPLGDLDLGLPLENLTTYPAPGQIIIYPGGLSECEILLAYGAVSFASKVGPLAGIHFITLTSGLDMLPELGRSVLWQGATSIRFEEI